MQKLIFYLGHSWNDLRVGGRRTLFALLCIAAGVAAVVSLQSLGAMIEASFTANVQELNRGDIRLLSPGIGQNRKSPNDIRIDRRYLETSGNVITVFTENALNAFEQTLRRYDEGASLSYRYTSPSNPLAGTFIETSEGSKPILGMFIEADQYPMYGEVRTIDGQLLRDVIKAPSDIVLSDNAAEEHGFSVGDKVQLLSGKSPFTIRGIVDRQTEALTENFAFVSLVGFYYADVSAASLFNEIDDNSAYAEEVYIKLSNDDPDFVSEMAERLEQQFPFVGVVTTASLREQNSQITGALSDLVLLMGVVSLLIGGIGIINTMLVIVARRMTEIAVLKTIGLKARQVTALFLVEAIILGILGGIIGCVLGIILAYFIQRSDVFFGTRLEWVLSGEVLLRGFVMGVLVTAVFGFLPTLIAGQIRPGNVLRPSSNQLPSVGVLQLLAALVVICVAMGLIVWSILGGGISPNAESAWSIVSVALCFGLIAGIGGAALMPNLALIKRSAHTLGIISLGLRWIFLLLGILAQTIFQGVLFFAAVIIAVALVEGRISQTHLFYAIGIGAVLGLLISIQTFRRQRFVFLTLGAILFGFGMMLLLGVAVGGGIGLLLYHVLRPAMPDIWALLVDIFTNIALVEATFVAVMALVGVLWFMVSLTAKLPALGVPDVKISLRALNVNRNRVSTTLLALVIGVLTLSLVTMFASSLKRFFAVNLENSLGGNALVFTLVGGGNWQNTLDSLENVLLTAEGMGDYSLIANYQVEFVALEKADGRRLKRAQLVEEIERNTLESGELATFLDLTLSSIDGRFVNHALPQKEFVGNNRQLGPEDEGQTVAVVSGNRAVRTAGIEAGDVLIFNFPNAVGNQPRQIRFTIVGVSNETLGDLSSETGSPIYAPIDAFSGIRPSFMGGIVNVQDEYLSAFRRRVVNEVNNTVVIETRYLNQIVNRLVDQFTALPFLVAFLNLITGGVVIANSVALSTMERRREIGVMKSLGVQRERVLGMLLLENSLMGFLAGLIGVGGSLILLIQLWAFLFDGELKGALPVNTALLLMLSCVGISLLAAILTAWGASGEKPLSVLRNE